MDAAEDFGGTLHVQSLLARGMTLNWFQNFQWQKWKPDIPYRAHLVTNISRSITVAELWRPKVTKHFWRFVFGKTTPYGKIFKVLFLQNSPPHQSTCCVQISWNLADGKAVKSCIAYMTKSQNFVWLSRSCYCVDLAKNLPGRAPDIVITVLQISSKLVHFRWSYTTTREYRESK